MDEPPIQTFMLLFPANAVKTATGDNVDYCVVHLSDRNHREWSIGSDFGITIPYLEHEHDRKPTSADCDSRGTVWFSGSGLYSDGQVVHTDDQIGADIATPQDLAFLRKMRSIVLQCMMAMSYRPDLLDESSLPAEGRARSPVIRNPKPQVWYPRWLGKDYRLPRQYSIGSGRHANPRPHWRKRHEKRVAVGPGRTDRKWVWIERTWVGEINTGNSTL